MPNIVNLTAKKADGTTTVTLTALRPNGGTLPAMYSNLAAGSAKAFRPVLEFSAKEAANGKSSRTYVKYEQPVVVNVDGVNTITDKAIFTLNGVIPATMNETEVRDACAIILTAVLNNASLFTAASTAEELI